MDLEGITRDLGVAARDLGAGARDLSVVDIFFAVDVL